MRCGFGKESVCPVCGRTFYHSSDWAYKKIPTSKCAKRFGIPKTMATAPQYICSYPCFRKFEEACEWTRLQTDENAGRHKMRDLRTGKVMTITEVADAECADVTNVHKCWNKGFAFKGRYIRYDKPRKEATEHGN